MYFDWTAAAIVTATLMGPILAVEIQKRLERAREAKGRKDRLFTTLMATRSIRVSPQHVEALNAIDLTFDGKDKKEEEVRRAWAAYLDVLNTPAERRAEPAYYLNFDAKFIELLYAISRAIGRDFDRTYLKNSWYRPQAHADLETATQEIQHLFLSVLKGERTLPVAVTDLSHN
jgi:hypothetical protein